MIDAVRLVKEFHERFGAPVRFSPQLLSEERHAFRARLQQEELDETKDATDIVEVADGLIDQLVLNMGWLLETGLWICLDELFAEVHRSNMSKACDTEEECQKHCEYLTERAVQESVEKIQPDFDASKDPLTQEIKGYGDFCKPARFGGKWICVRHDGKVLKGPHYSKPDLKPIIDRAKVNGVAKQKQLSLGDIESRYPNAKITIK